MNMFLCEVNYVKILVLRVRKITTIKPVEFLEMIPAQQYFFVKNTFGKKKKTIKSKLKSRKKK